MTTNHFVDTTTGKPVNFRLVNEERINPDGPDAARRFTWCSMDLVDNFEIAVELSEADLAMNGPDVVLEAARDRAAIELKGGPTVAAIIVRIRRDLEDRIPSPVLEELVDAWAVDIRRILDR